MDIKHLKKLLRDVEIEVEVHGGGKCPSVMPPASRALIVALQAEFTAEELVGFSGAAWVAFKQGPVSPDNTTN